MTRPLSASPFADSLDIAKVVNAFVHRLAY
jgi:hypothetical protein